MKRIATLVGLGVLFLTLASFAGDKDSFSDLKFLVVKEANEKPVRNASVVLHPVDKDGRQEKGGMQLKTDSEGRTSFNGVPFGKMRIQVIAHGLQTFGQDYDINQPQQEIVIKLKPPQEQYSIYDKK
ncbi:MAG TPA: carboxypeptidase-like regulatory domain-containing protein [Terriglobales bacterium]|jgi:hypothetical protein|nr:carboxypeptidase-like regulatory domain-containing protein [Terriglobales bacterium]